MHTRHCRSSTVLTVTIRPLSGCSPEYAYRPLYTALVRYVLVGNYGVGNFGDEALREYFLRAFPEGEWLVLSAHRKTGELPRLSAGFRSLFLTPWWRTLRALRSSDGLVFGGGTLFTDIESVGACLLWWWHAFVCWMLRKPFFLAFQGIGPFRTRVGEWCARWTVRHARFVSVRDDATFQRVQSWKMNTKIIQTADPALSLFKAENNSSSSQKLLVIIPRGNSSIPFNERATALRNSESWDAVHILSLQPEDRAEQHVCRSIAGALSLPESAIIAVGSVEALIAEVSGAQLVLAERYHGALAALALGVPCEAVPQAEGDKLSSLSGLSAPALSALLSDGENALRKVLFPVFSESGRIQL
ncbi:MAG: polysaccharide pyruvyl transferase CsaB [Candidatus Peribacter riflensis]|uniref:Polysaccharide pyruvyl transferase CsaB n=1 Tax=Candidatus Peribacter riflensis TaxID=1735162 RepID=A0A0S1SMS7_9BACT|nr:MAG: polysaccharide pyruvyl transferase CsaB [Candidatus Peribacter riflensis]ALM11037.1 MAG: polysaccharide pyruvyl transferase CsaB [Candidatus Peribacter riflensis]ALM12140.1 MAG: polysaccharide pyruvyl transferase CsaB [Candidatus Peribacter riflensis]ALM13243.1 MAG: polysaccharide pyruvyl transferase CsaB [Candidatus Peribacter riflensis]ALM14343.1 MAG: polysaccharide pyruvyl transferase CsaB [Candidatus Peribacter riflensis]